MDFDVWLADLATELERQLALGVNEGRAYIAGTGMECWREMFDDGLSPRDAAAEEVWASAGS